MQNTENDVAVDASFLFLASIIMLAVWAVSSGLVIKVNGGPRLADIGLKLGYFIKPEYLKHTKTCDRYINVTFRIQMPSRISLAVPLRIFYIKTLTVSFKSCLLSLFSAVYMEYCMFTVYNITTVWLPVTFQQVYLAVEISSF